MLDNKISFPEGKLSIAEILAISKTLPIDINFIDKDGIFQYYNDDRIFPRSTQALGKTILECHSPKTHPMVEEIIHEFEEGNQDRIEFWQNQGDQLIHIQYIAVRDNIGQYLGCLETIQDISTLKHLDGERREIHWPKK